MLLTAPLLSKSLWGSLVKKCRQVIVKTTTDNKNTVENSKDSAFASSSTTPPPPPSVTSIAFSANLIKTPKDTSPLQTTINELNFSNTSASSRPALGAALNVATTVNPCASEFSTSNVIFRQSTTLEERLGLPPRPKKPLTPYFRFLRDMRPKFVAQNPKVDTREVVRVLSQEWSKADAGLKARLQEEYEKERSKYREQRMKYDAKLTEEQKAEIKQYKQDVIDMKERRQMRLRTKELGKPKRPISAFIRFMQNERVATPQRPDQTFKEWHVKCTAQWARLSDAEKEKYMKDARKDIEQYKKDLAAWEQKMIKAGNVDVVRPSNLIDPPEPKKKAKPQQQKQKH